MGRNDRPGRGVMAPLCGPHHGAISPSVGEQRVPRRCDSAGGFWPLRGRDFRHRCGVADVAGVVAGEGHRREKYASKVLNYFLQH